MNGKIRLSKSSISQTEKEAVLKVLDNGFLGMGEQVKLFEEKIKNPKYDSEGNRIENSYKNLNKNSITYNKLEKAHPFIFWATFIIFITLFIFIINYFIKSLFTKF